MKFYLLVEGAQTEKKLLRAWLGHCFPQLAEVSQPADLRANSFFLLAGMGYPSYLQRIPNALADAARFGADHLFICIDAEERSYEERRAEVQGILEETRTELQKRGLQHVGQQHIIVATCCIESWLLGHKKFVPRQPTSEPLTRFKQFYMPALGTIVSSERCMHSSFKQRIHLISSDLLFETYPTAAKPDGKNVTIGGTTSVFNALETSDESALNGEHCDKSFAHVYIIKPRFCSN